MAHLTLAQRYTIECMHKRGYKQKDISEAINKDKSVVSREFPRGCLWQKRNCDLRNNTYRSSLAQQKYTKRQKEKPHKQYFTSEIKAYIDDKLYKKFSPEQIVRGDAFGIGTANPKGMPLAKELCGYGVL